jgi:hypothetical protein
MSRHRLVDDLEVFVGWDPPLQTFFLQVFYPTAEDEDEVLLLSLGEEPGEMPELAHLESALASNAGLVSNAVLTPDLRQALEEEKATSPEPSALQRWAIDLFASSK